MVARNDSCICRLTKCMMGLNFQRKSYCDTEQYRSELNTKLKTNCYFTWVGSSKFNRWLISKGWKADTLTPAFQWSKSRSCELSAVYILNGGAKNFVVKKGRTNDKNVTRVFSLKITLTFYLLLMSVSFTHFLYWQREVQIIYDQDFKFHNLNRSYWFF